MLCICQTPREYYKHRLAKTRENILNHVYENAPTPPIPKTQENTRLRLRYKEAVQEAYEICSKDGTSDACYLAWYEVDDLEDSMLRLYPDTW